MLVIYNTIKDVCLQIPFKPSFVWAFMFPWWRVKLWTFWSEPNKFLLWHKHRTLQPCVCSHAFMHETQVRPGFLHLRLVWGLNEGCSRLGIKGLKYEATEFWHEDTAALADLAAKKVILDPHVHTNRSANYNILTWQNSCFFLNLFHLFILDSFMCLLDDQYNGKPHSYINRYRLCLCPTLSNQGQCLQKPVPDLARQASLRAYEADSAQWIKSFY